MTELTWLEGAISIEAALKAGNRDIHGIYFRQEKRNRRDWRLKRLRKLAEQAGIALKRVDEAFIQTHVSGQSHGGVLAQVGPRRFLSLDELVVGKRPFIVMLDGVEDPFNFGQSIRSLYAAGVDGVVVRPRNWTTAVSVVTRASAGATEHMPMAIAETADVAAAVFRQHGLTIACTSQETAVSLYESDLTQPMFLLLGGEKRGITRSFLSQSDLRIEIPYQRAFTQSLGTTASTAVIAFERMRQVELNR
ncbi:MAG: RNA methyltransferase [Chloroflexi bacterium]|nr:RNA methyltransferase [Chloroflexota bacterium]